MTRSKRLLRQALIDLLSSQPFESISVKAICDKAQISRITFYTHFSDKYDLAESIFQEVIELGTDDYAQLQQQSNPNNDPVLAYCNMLDSILKQYSEHYDFFQHTAPNKNPYLSASFYSHVMDIVEQHTHRASSVLLPRYPVRAITAFLCFGLGGFISESHELSDHAELDARTILHDVLSSNILTRLHRPQSAPSFTSPADPT